MPLLSEERAGRTGNLPTYRYSLFQPHNKNVSSFSLVFRLGQLFHCIYHFGLLSQCTCRLYLSFSLQISITFYSIDQYLKRDTLVTWPTAQKLQSPMQVIWHDFEPITCIFHQHHLFTSDDSSCHPQRKCYFCKKLLLRYSFTQRSSQIVRLPCCTLCVRVCVCECRYIYIYIYCRSNSHKVSQLITKYLHT
jgi:hypothetical protein